MSAIRFYFDENMPTEIEEQLRRSGIDVVSARSLTTLSDNDVGHLKRATEMNRVICTHDTDFIPLASEFPDHCGIIWAANKNASIGGWVKKLLQLHQETSAEDMIGQVKFISVK